jgi:hypothetical protein
VASVLRQPKARCVPTGRRESPFQPS